MYGAVPYGFSGSFFLKDFASRKTSEKCVAVTIFLFFLAVLSEFCNFGRSFYDLI